MYELTTKSGLTMDCDLFVHNAKSLYVRVFDCDLIRVATIFSDPEHTAALTWHGEAVSGFTELESIAMEDGGIKINLIKE